MLARWKPVDRKPAQEIERLRVKSRATRERLERLEDDYRRAARRFRTR
jgi:hypothetical protein